MCRRKSANTATTSSRCWRATGWSGVSTCAAGRAACACGRSGPSAACASARGGWSASGANSTASPGRDRPRTRPHRPLLRLRRPGLRERLDQGEPGIAGTGRVPSEPGAWSRRVRSQELPFFPDAGCRLSPRQFTMSAGDRWPSDARFVPLVWSRRQRNAPFKWVAAPASIGGRARLKSPIAAAYIPPLQRRGSPP